MPSFAPHAARHVRAAVSRSLLRRRRNRATRKKPGSRRLLVALLVGAVVAERPRDVSGVGAEGA